MNAIDNLPPLREVIAKHKLSAQRSLGQNFILDLNITNKIARQAGELKGFDILEIGPGPGALTRSLLAEGARKVLAIEKDFRCIGALKQIAQAYPDRLQIIEEDALNINFMDHLKPPIRIVSNLPYNVGTQLLIRWLTAEHWPSYWDSLTLMFQREVADRIVARPGSKAYGRLAILTQWRCDARITMSLPPSAFIPAPRVSSAVVHFKALKKARFEADQKTLEVVVNKAFNQRRKMLRSSLKNICQNIEKILENSEINPTQRAEEISLEKFCSLARCIQRNNEFPRLK